MNEENRTDIFDITSTYEADQNEPMDADDDIDGKEPAPVGKKVITEIYGMLHDLVYILVTVTLLFVFVIRLVGVEGKSMLPTLQDGDFLLLESNFLYGPEDIECGDIVVLNEPYHRQRSNSLIVKRVIATEGQEVYIDYDEDKVYVDGEALDENYINEQDLKPIRADELPLPATVPEGHIFVLGDNRNNSSDSRELNVGMIDSHCVLGKAIVVVLPGQPKDDANRVIGKRDWGRIGLIS